MVLGIQSGTILLRGVYARMLHAAKSDCVSKITKINMSNSNFPN